jgi:hypothetical protein
MKWRTAINSLPEGFHAIHWKIYDSEMRMELIQTTHTYSEDIAWIREKGLHLCERTIVAIVICCKSANPQT